MDPSGRGCAPPSGIHHANEGDGDLHTRHYTNIRYLAVRFFRNNYSLVLFTEFELFRQSPKQFIWLVIKLIFLILFQAVDT